MKFKVFLSLLFCSCIAFSQITISSGISASEANTNSTECGPFSPPVINSSGAVEGIDSFGTFIFTRGGSGSSTTFELERGIILSTGNLEQFNEGSRVEGGTAWGGSSFFETAVGAPTGSSINATDLTFSFTALQQQIDLKYVFGSNQYAIANSCISEGAAILWKGQSEPETAFQNIALVNGSTVTIANINRTNAGACSDENAAVLTGAQGLQDRVPSVTRYTQALSASINNLTIGETYELRLVVADVDLQNDSVLFLEYPENNFSFTETASTSIGQLRALSPNNFEVTVCAPSTTIGFRDPFTTGVSYSWTGPTASSIIGNSTASRVEVDTSGTYTLTVNPTNLESCTIIKTFEVDITNTLNVIGVSDLAECASGGTVTFDLREKESEIGSIANNGSINQFTYSDSSNNAIANPASYSATDGAVVNFEVEFSTGCIGQGNFVLRERMLPIITPDRDPNNPDERLEICDIETFDANNLSKIDGIIILTETELTNYYFPSVNTGTINYFQNTAGTIDLPPDFEFSGTTNITARFTDDEGCQSDVIPLTVTVKSPPSGIPAVLEPLRACGIEEAPDIYRATFDLTENIPVANEPISVTFHEAFDDANREEVFQPIANSTSFRNTPAPLNQQEIFARIVNASNPNCPIIRPFQLLPYFTITENLPLLGDIYLCEEQVNSSSGLIEADFLPELKANVFDPINTNPFFNVRILQTSATGPELAIPDTITSETYFVSEDTSVFIEISSNQSLPSSTVPYPVCTEVYELKLYVNPLGTINTPTTEVFVCGDSEGVFRGIVSEFTDKIALEITANANIQLQYYSTLTEAELDNNPITNMTATPANTTPITYFARGFVTPTQISNDQRRLPGVICPTNITQVILNVEQELELEPNPVTTIFVCSENESTLATFRVSQEIETIVDNSQPNIAISYHRELADAEDNLDPIIDDAGSPYNQLTFASIDNDATFFVRIEDTSTTTGCFSVVERQAVFSVEPDTPNFVTDTDDFLLCVPDGDPLTRVFDLSSKNTELIGNVTGRTINYYDSEANAIASTTTGRLNQNGHPVTGMQIIWYNVTNDNNPNCNSIGQLRLRVASLAEVEILDIRQCSGISNGFGSFNLEAIREPIVTDTSLNVASIEFYRFENDAGFNITPGQEIPDAIPGTAIALSIEGNYNNEVAFSQEIIARITSDQGCVTFRRFLLVVEDTPQMEVANFNACVSDLTSPQDIRRTMADFTFINARSSNVVLRNNNEIEYFTNPTRDLASRIDNANSFVVNGNLQTIYTRVYFASIGSDGENCFTDAQFNVNLNIFPQVNSNAAFLRCEDAPNSGTYTIDLTNVSTTELEMIYNGNDNNVEIRFFDSPARINPITSFVRTPSNNEIFAAAFIIRGGQDICDSGSSTTIALNAIDLPELNALTELFICDNDTSPLDGTTNSSLVPLKSQIINEPTDELGDYSIRFFEGTNELLGSNYALTDGNTYTAVVNNNLKASCAISVDFTLRLISGPIIGDTSIPVLSLCDTNNDSQEVFNLTLVENLAPFDNVVNFTFEYFSDAARITPIPGSSLSNYTVNGIGRQEVFVKLTSTIDSNCQFDSSFQIQLFGQPNITATTTVVDYCSNETLGAIRAELIDLVSSGLSTSERNNLIFTLHSNPDGSDIALTDDNVINSSFIYVKAVDTSTTLQCEAIQGVEVQRVLPPAIDITFAPQECDVDGVNDGSISILLSNYNETIFAGPENELANHTINYFNNSDDTPLAGVVSINSSLPIRAEVTQNNSPNCTSTLVFTVGIQTGPTVFTPTSNLLTICNDSEVLDNSTLYGDVNALETAIRGNQDPATHQVLFFHTTLDAEDNANAIDFNTVEVTTQNYIAKVRNLNTTCETLGMIPIKVSNLPEIGALTDNSYCENSTIGMNKIRWDRQILVNIPLAQQINFSITYHSGTTADELNRLEDEDTVPDVGQITIKLTNPDGCFSIETTPTNKVNLPIINTLTREEAQICDNDDIQDGITTYSFSNLNTAFLRGQTPIADFRFSYHNSELDAENAIELSASTTVTTDTYYVKLENVSTGCSQIQPFDIVVNTIPTINDNFITICQFDDDGEEVNKQTTDINDRYLWEFADADGLQTRADETTPNIRVFNTDVNTFATLTVTNTFTECSNTKVFEIFENITPRIEVVVNNNFGSGTAIIEVNEGDNFTYALTGPVTISPQESNEFINLLPGTYQVSVFSPDFCTPATTEFTYVDYLPYFSPNDDGISDKWEVNGLSTNFPGAIVYIHDRFGKLLKTLTGDASWDGTYEGTPLPSDDYWVLIEFTDRPSIKDHITLKR